MKQEKQQATMCIITPEIRKRNEEMEKRIRENCCYESNTLVIRIDWWLWRNIAMSWAITEVAKKRDVKVIASRPLVFWWNPYIKSVHWLDDRRLFEDVIRWCDYKEIEPYTDPEFFNEWKNRLYIVQKQLWLEKVAEPCLFLAEHEKINNFLQGEKPILFQPFWSTMQQNWCDKSYRSIKVKDAQYIADWLIRKWYTVYVVERPDQPKLNWCVCLDTPDMRFVVSLCDRYPVLGCDSCLHHASKWFWKKATVIRAWTDAERYWYESNVNLREFPMIAHTPLRLNMNDFNFDISNQHTNEFTKEFLDKIIALY